MTDAPFRPLLRTQRQVESAWAHLMGPWGFGSASLWLMVIGPDDRPIPQLTEITDLEPLPDDELLESVARLLRDLGAPDVRFAFLRSRPGSAVVTDDDRAWATMLYAAAHDAEVACEVVHLATTRRVTPLPMDDLPASA